MNKVEGPSEVIIPEQRYISCYGCKWYDRRLYRSGKNPLYKQTCTNKDRPIYAEEIGGIRMAETPDWCPIIKQNNETNKNNNS